MSGIRISRYGTDRLDIYRPSLEAPGCQIALNGASKEALFFDPFDQLMRQQLLCSAMEREGEMGADVVSLLHIVPAANREFLGRVAGIPDNPEDILSGQLEYGKPVVDLAAGDAHALVAAPRNALRTVAALVSTQSEGVDQPAFEAGMGLEITPQLALDGSGLVFAGAVPLTYPRPPAPVLDALEKGLSGCDGREDQGNSSRNCPLDVFHRPGPLDLSERGVDGDELVVGNHPGDKQAHGLAVLPARDVERNESPAPDHLPALSMDWDIGG